MDYFLSRGGIGDGVVGALQLGGFDGKHWLRDTQLHRL
jgi:hypothetical protein